MLKNKGVTYCRATMSGFISFIFYNMNAYLDLEFKTCSIDPFFPIKCSRSNNILKDIVLSFFNRSGLVAFTILQFFHYLFYFSHFIKLTDVVFNFFNMSSLSSYALSSNIFSFFIS